MKPDDFARIAYLILLLIAIGGYFVAQNRSSLGQNLRHALLWGLIFLGVMAGAGLWQDLRHDIIPRQHLSSAQDQIILPRAADGHFYAQLKIDGEAIDFMVDTGASAMVLAKQDAQKIGIDLGKLRFIGRAFSANGEVKTAPVDLGHVAFMGHEIRHFRAWVNDGEMRGSLLGNDYLQLFSRIEIQPNQLILTP